MKIKRIHRREDEHSSSGKEQKENSHPMDETLVRPLQQSLLTQHRSPAGWRNRIDLLDHPRFLENLNHVDRNEFPEWLVHARGSGAHGYFQPYRSMCDCTTAAFLQDPELRTPVFVRFSTVVGSSGSADRVRNVHGFETRFYTDDGYYDLVANNMPVYLIQAGIRYPDMVHSIKPDPDNPVPGGMNEHNNFWEFVSHMPESLHMIMWLLSDRGIPRSFRMMEGYGVHFSRFINEEGRERHVKFHWKPLLGTHSLAWDEAQKLRGKEPDWLRRDLWKAIDRGDHPEYELGVQMVGREEIDKHGLDLNDATRIIPEDLVPVTPVGKMTLNRNARYGKEINRVDFHPDHVVPGIAPPEPGGRTKSEDRESRFRDHYIQARIFWKRIGEAEKRHIIQAAQYELSKVRMEIRRRMITHFFRIATELGNRVAEGLDVHPDGEEPVSAVFEGEANGGDRNVSEFLLNPSGSRSIKSRKIAIVAEQGVDAEEVQQVREALVTRGARVDVISKLKGVIAGENGTEITADTSFVSSGSIRYDAIWIPGGKAHAEDLKMQGEARYFVNEAFSHCKTIAATGEGVDFLRTCRNGHISRGEAEADGIICAEQPESLEDTIGRFAEAVARHRHWNRELRI